MKSVSSNGKKELGRASINTVMLYLLTIAKMIVPLITLPYLTRVLTTDAYGTVSYVKAMMSYVQIVIDFGFLYSAVKDIVLIGKNKKNISQVTSNTLFIKLLLAILSFIVVLILGLTVPILQGSLIYVLLAFLTPLLSIFLLDFFFRGIEKMHFVTITFLVVKVISTVLTMIFVKSDNDILLIPIFEAIGSLVAVVVSFLIYFLTGHRIVLPKIQDSFKSLGISFSYFLNSMASTAFGVLLTLVIGIIIPDLKEVSYWSVCMQLVAAVQSLYTPISNGIYPYMVKRKNLKLIVGILVIFFPIVVLGCLFCLFFAPQILNLVSGKEYVDAAPIFQVLVPVLFLSFPVAIIGWPVFGPINKRKEMTISTIIGAIVQALGIVVLLLINQVNLIAIAITRIISEFAMLFIRSIFAFKYRKLFKETFNLDDSLPECENTNLKVSIIIPCYNSADLIINNFGKVITDNYDQFEFIVCDDCSSDGSYEKLLDYSKFTKFNLKVLKNKTNLGPGLTRNACLEVATGDFITCLDSDDYFDIIFYSKVIKRLSKECDMYYFDYYSVGKKKQYAKCLFAGKVNHENINDVLVYSKGMPWGKMYRKDIIKDYNIKFCDRRRNEDTPFTKTAISYCKKVKYINYPLYNYVQRKGSLMSDNSLLIPNSGEISFNIIKRDINPSISSTELEGIFAKDYLYSAMISNIPFHNKKEWKEIIVDIIKQYPNYNKNSYVKRFPLSKKLILFLGRKGMYHTIKLIRKIVK